MKLELQKRKARNKGETNRLRKEGNIPVVLYGAKREAASFFLKADGFASILRSLKPGLLATQVFLLTVDGKQVKAIIKDIQYHVTSYDVRHIDFFELDASEKVSLNVPIQLEGVADCAGVKLGGSLRQVIRSMKVRCLPEKIPSEFSLDVKSLGIGETVRLSDLKIPEGVEPKAQMAQVAVLVSGGKKAGA